MRTRRHSKTIRITQKRTLRCGLLALVVWLANFYAASSQAQDGRRDPLATAQQRCGTPPGSNTQQGREASLNTLAFEPKLELVIHFPAGSTEIPKDCTSRLGEIAQAVKDGKTGGLLIRSSTSTGSSSELDLAIASSRLDTVAQFFRDMRLARKAMTLELHPETSSLMGGASIETPRVVEIYSSSAN